MIKILIFLCSILHPFKAMFSIWHSNCLAEVTVSSGQILSPAGHLRIDFLFCNSKKMICMLTMRAAPMAN